MSDAPGGGKPMSGAAARGTNLSRPFWEAAARQRLLLQFDPVSGRCQFYPRPLGVHSATHGLEWRESAGLGTLIAFTRCHAPMRGLETEVPYLTGLVKLDEGVKLFTRIVHVDYAALRIGQRMRVCWDERGIDPLFRFEPA